MKMKPIRSNKKEGNETLLRSPDLEGELEVLAAPDVEAGVVGPEALEEGLVDGEETARHGGRLHGLGGVLVAGALPLRDGVPVELRKRAED